MEERRKMNAAHITSKLRRYLKKHKDELIYATTRFKPTDVMNFEVFMEDDFSGKDYYAFYGKIEYRNPEKDYITDRVSIKGNIYIEEGEDNEPKFKDIKTIYLSY